MYIKNIFRYRIARHSEVKSHCITHGTSEFRSKHFSGIEECEGEFDMIEDVDFGNENLALNRIVISKINYLSYVGIFITC